MFGKSNDFFYLNIRNYPGSSNVFDSMGDWYVCWRREAGGGMLEAGSWRQDAGGVRHEIRGFMVEVLSRRP